jgi:hypothetical protein
MQQAHFYLKQDHPGQLIDHQQEHPPVEFSDFLQHMVSDLY